MMCVFSARNIKKFVRPETPDSQMSTAISYPKSMETPNIHCEKFHDLGSKITFRLFPCTLPFLSSHCHYALFSSNQPETRDRASLQRVANPFLFPLEAFLATYFPLSFEETKVGVLACMVQHSIISGNNCSTAAISGNNDRSVSQLAEQRAS